MTEKDYRVIYSSVFDFVDILSFLDLMDDYDATFLGEELINHFLKYKPIR